MRARTPIMSHKEQGILSSPATSKSGILLIPKPTSDPEDPLVKCLLQYYLLCLSSEISLILAFQNWSSARKIRLLAVLCLAAFSGNVSALSGQLAYPHQAAVYGKTILESSYSVREALLLPRT